MNIKLDGKRVQCKGCMGTNFEIETKEGVIAISCSKCGADIGSKYVKEEMLYFSKREGYRSAYDEMKDFVTEKRENDMVRRKI